MPLYGYTNKAIYESLVYGYVMDTTKREFMHMSILM